MRLLIFLEISSLFMRDYTLSINLKKFLNDLPNDENLYMRQMAQTAKFRVDFWGERGDN